MFDCRSRPFRQWRTGICLIFLAILAGVSGCGDKSNRQKVTGTVKFGGELLDQGTIEFHPEGSGGTFEGGTIVQGMYEIPSTRGLAPGKYRVIISSSDAVSKGESMPGQSGPPAKERIPKEFNTETKQTVEVQTGKPNIFDFDVPKGK